jgi:hypothetical protein
MQPLSLMIVMGILAGAIWGCSAGARNATDSTAGGAANAGGRGGASNAGAAGTTDGGAEVAWCDAYAVTKAKCASCHENPTDAAIKFSDYNSTKPIAPLIKISITTGSMPKPDPSALTAPEKQTLLDWINQGAKDTGGLTCK